MAHRIMFDHHRFYQPQNQNMEFTSLRSRVVGKRVDSQFPTLKIDEILLEPKTIPPHRPTLWREAKASSLTTIELNHFPSGVYAIFLGSANWQPRMKGHYRTQKKAVTECKKMFEAYKKRLGGKDILIRKDEADIFHGEFYVSKGECKGVLMSFYTGTRPCLNLNLKDSQKFCENWRLSSEGTLQQLRQRIYQFLMKRRTVLDLLQWKEDLKSQFLSGQETPFIRSEEDVMEVLRKSQISLTQFHAGQRKNETETGWGLYKKEDWAKYIDEGQERILPYTEFMSRQEFGDTHNPNGELEKLSDSEDEPEA